MKQLLVKKIDLNHPKASELSLAFDKASIPSHPIDTVNWEAYPYCPKVTFRIAHNNDAVLLNYKVNESDIKAVCNQDNGRVWEDSCVEFFVSFAEGWYCNIECNCIGKILIGKSSFDRRDRTQPSEDLFKQVDRWSSLGYSPVENLSGDWEVSLVIPNIVFYPHIANTFENVKARANFYKCGDRLKTPHFLSWNPIQSNSPNFHLPEFFGQLLFE